MRHVDAFHNKLPVVDKPGSAAFLQWLQGLTERLAEGRVTTHAATEIADATSALNTEQKVVGKRVIDTTNNRMLYASGETATAVWYVVDGSASVTPA